MPLLNLLPLISLNFADFVNSVDHWDSVNAADATAVSTAAAATAALQTWIYRRLVIFLNTLHHNVVVTLRQELFLHKQHRRTERRCAEHCDITSTIRCFLCHNRPPLQPHKTQIKQTVQNAPIKFLFNPLAAFRIEYWRSHFMHGNFSNRHVRRREQRLAERNAAGSTSVVLLEEQRRQFGVGGATICRHDYSNLAIMVAISLKQATVFRCFLPSSYLKRTSKPSALNRWHAWEDRGRRIQMELDLDKSSAGFRRQCY